uniref:Uncharacterized protein n=1 Tax=Caenorhabditis japonica TaxID=281687 RepID=A0A8R1DGN6_CAEJA
MDTPMSVFSMETVFSYMEIEKIWNIRRENLILQRFIDTIKPTNMKKWYVSSLEINGDRIGRRKRFSNDPDVS